MCGGGGAPSYQKVETPAPPAPAPSPSELELGTKKDTLGVENQKSKKGKKQFRVDLKQNTLGTNGMSDNSLNIPSN